MITVNGTEVADRLGAVRELLRQRAVELGLLEPDARGRWGLDRAFGGRFVPETLMSALLDLEAAYAALRQEPAFWAELREPVVLDILSARSIAVGRVRTIARVGAPGGGGST